MTYKTPVVVELFYSAAWHDETSNVLVGSPITITRGRSDESQQVSPGALSLVFENNDARYSPRNPLSPLYGLIGRNTPIRVSVTGFGTRFVGSIESWPQSWDTKSVNATVAITANGVLRRLGGLGTQAREDTAIHRYLMSGAQTGLVAYWPLEGGELTPDVGTKPMLITYTDSQGTSDSGGELATWLRNGMSLDGTISMDGQFPAKPGGTITNIDAVWMIRNGLPNNTSSGAATLGIYDVAIVDGVAWDYWINMVWTSGTPTLELWRHQVTGSSTLMHAYDAVSAAKLWDGNVHQLGISLSGSGTNVNLAINIDGVNPAISYSHGATSTLWDSPHWKMGASGLQSAAVGHVQVWARSSSLSVSSIYSYASGWQGETSATRIARICTEEGITCTATGGATLMGPQPVGSVLGWIQEAADADAGVLSEDRTQLGLIYEGLSTFYNAAVGLTLNYTGTGEVAPPLLPVEDTQHVANDVTVTRTNGGSTQVTRATGALNTSEPTVDPQGVGRYPAQYTLNVQTDSQTLQQAGLKLYLGTFDEPRYPTVSVDLTALQNAGKTSLMTTVAGLNVGDRIEITNPPAWQGPDTVSQLVQGYTEVLGSHHWTITFNTFPARPFDVGNLNTDRLDTGGSTTTSTMTTGTTSLPVTSPGALWGTSTPYDVVVEGERMTVTAVSGAGPTQTLTVTRSVNGIVKTHGSGATVRLYQNQLIRLAR